MPAQMIPHPVGFRETAHGLNPGPIVVVGAGLAGLFTALKLAPLPVTGVTAAQLGRGAASAWAQGGIAAAVGEGDTIEAHAHDTIKAGAGLVDTKVAHAVAREASARITDLLRLGVPFDRDLDGHFLLSKEAAHSRNRIVRVSGDRAGAAIMRALIATVRATPSITVIEGFELEDLVMSDGRVTGLRLAGVGEHCGEAFEFVPASAVVLATGGVGSLYDVTTNPSYARGASLAIAARAGAVISDAEFVQFHPTALDFGIAPAPLATESLRGEGARLVNGEGERFMNALHPDGDLGPRDIVARGVFSQVRSGHVAFLDCRDAIGEQFADRFPTVYASARKAGYDPAKQLLPIVTAAHYHMGGIATDARARSNVVGLWAVGEAAATGLHGANRLASNSLLETVVFGARAARDITTLVSVDQARTYVSPRAVERSRPIKLAARTQLQRKLRKVMSRHVGVVRDEAGLRTANRELRALEKIAGEDMQVSNMVLAARFITSAALLREESRGAQYRSDFPNARGELQSRSYLSLSDIETSREGITPQRARGGLQTSVPVPHEVNA